MSAFTSRSGWVCAAAAVVLGSSLMVVRAAADEAGKPKTEAKAETKAEAKSTATIKLTKPWNDLTSLTSEQRAKIKDIHAKALAQINEIEKQEKADIMAVLNDAQKTELAELAAKERQAAREKRTTAKKADSSAEKPAEK